MEKRKRIWGVFLVFAAVLMLSGAAPVQARAASADVNVIAGSKTARPGTWVSLGSYWKYRFTDGRYANDGFRKIDGKIYYFYPNGIMASGWIKVGSFWYYASGSGAIVQGQWVYLGGKWYYLHTNGVMFANRWLTWKGTKYYVDSSGAMLTNRWVAYKGYWFYVSASGSYYTSRWLYSGGKYYYLMANGAMAANRWIIDKGQYYYLMANGVMAANTWVGDRYVNASGAMLRSCTYNGYTFGANGRVVESALTEKYLIIGDSRIVGMDQAVSASDVAFIGKVGAGYSWLYGTVWPQLRAELARDPNRKVILCMGINDLGNINSYLIFYRNLIRRYPKTRIYISTVSGINQKLAAGNGYRVTNAQIVEFNRKLKAGIPAANLVDTCTYMNKVKFETLDGIHYLASTYIKMYTYMRKCMI